MSSKHGRVIVTVELLKQHEATGEWIRYLVKSLPFEECQITLEAGIKEWTDEGTGWVHRAADEQRKITVEGELMDESEYGRLEDMWEMQRQQPALTSTWMF